MARDAARWAAYRRTMDMNHQFEPRRVVKWPAEDLPKPKRAWSKPTLTRLASEDLAQAYPRTSALVDTRPRLDFDPFIHEDVPPERDLEERAHSGIMLFAIISGLLVGLGFVGSFLTAGEFALRLL